MSPFIPDFEWRTSTSERYAEMLNVLPPAVERHGLLTGAFLMGEPYDHRGAGSTARFYVFRRIGDRYQAGSRPVTEVEFYAIT